MPRIASLHSINQPSSSPHGTRHRRLDRKFHIRSPRKPRSRPTLRLFHRPRTLSHARHTPTWPSFFARHTQTTKRPSTTSWGSRFSFWSRTSQQQTQPLTLEEKLRIAGDRVRRFERQTRPSTSPRFSPQTPFQPKSKTKNRTRFHTRLSKLHTHPRNRDRAHR